MDGIYTFLFVYFVNIRQKVAVSLEFDQSMKRKRCAIAVSHQQSKNCGCEGRKRVISGINQTPFRPMIVIFKGTDANDQSALYISPALPAGGSPKVYELLVGVEVFWNLI